jgi:hypothetical protein
LWSAGHTRALRVADRDWTPSVARAAAEKNQLNQSLTAHAQAESLKAGDYYVFFDTTAFFGNLGPFANTYELTAHLRPVLDHGQACDPAGAANRCGAATCPASGTAVCP